MSRGARLLSVLLSLLAVAALASLDGKVLVIGVPLLMYLGTGLAFAPRNARLEAARSLERQSTRHGASIEVTVTVLNRGPGIEELVLVDGVPRSLPVEEGSPRHVLTLGSGQSTRWTYTVGGVRGEHAWDDLDAEADCFCGIFGREERLVVPNRLLVLPVAERLSAIRIRPRQTRGFAGPIPSRAAGSGTRFLGVREYRPGDPLRRINSRLMARHPRALFTNEFEQERIADVGVVLDTRGQSWAGPHGKRHFEAAVSAALSLAESFLKEGNRVALLGYGYGMTRVPPGLGRVQLQRIRVALAHAEAGTNYALDTLDLFPTRMFPARSQIAVVTPLQRGDVRALGSLCVRGYSLLVVSPDPLDAGDAEDLARRIVRLERSLELAELRRAGVRTVDWPVSSPLGGALREALARQPLDRSARGLWR